MVYYIRKWHISGPVSKCYEYGWSHSLFWEGNMLVWSISGNGLSWTVGAQSCRKHVSVPTPWSTVNAGANLQRLCFPRPGKEGRRAGSGALAWRQSNANGPEPHRQTCRLRPSTRPVCASLWDHLVIKSWQSQDTAPKRIHSQWRVSPGRTYWVLRGHGLWGEILESAGATRGTKPHATRWSGPWSTQSQQDSAAASLREDLQVWVRRHFLVCSWVYWPMWLSHRALGRRPVCTPVILLYQSRSP